MLDLTSKDGQDVCLLAPANACMKSNLNERYSDTTFEQLDHGRLAEPSPIRKREALLALMQIDTLTYDITMNGFDTGGY